MLMVGIEKAEVGMKINATKKHDTLFDKVGIRPIALCAARPKIGRPDEDQFSIQLKPQRFLARVCT
jgi:hypothetical protein